MDAGAGVLGMGLGGKTSEERWEIENVGNGFPGSEPRGRGGRDDNALARVDDFLIAPNRL